MGSVYPRVRGGRHLGVGTDLPGPSGGSGGGCGLSGGATPLAWIFSKGSVGQTHPAPAPAWRTRRCAVEAVRVACGAGLVQCGVAMFAGSPGEIATVSVLAGGTPIVLLSCLLPGLKYPLSPTSKRSARPGTMKAMPWPQSEGVVPPLNSPIARLYLCCFPGGVRHCCQDRCSVRTLRGTLPGPAAAGRAAASERTKGRGQERPALSPENTLSFLGSFGCELCG